MPVDNPLARSGDGTVENVSLDYECISDVIVHELREILRNTLDEIDLINIICEPVFG